jgi:hypothetical protein
MPAVGDIEIEEICDDAKGHYELVYNGWDGIRRIQGPVIHIDIRGDQVLIQHDGTSTGVAYDLLRGGVHKEDIVLAFKPPFRRADTIWEVA